MEKKILEFCKRNKTGELLVIAPTGSGKTTSVCKLSMIFPEIFGRTWIIEPTKLSNHAIQGKGMTPLKAIERFLQESYFSCDTLVLDEIHTRSVEYETLLYFLSLRRTPLRLLMMTATPCNQRLQSWFPDLQVLTFPSLFTPFPVEIEYFPCRVFPFNQQIMVYIENLINSRKDINPRILVFLSTHEECDRMVRYFSSKYQDIKARSLYGGMDHDEWESFHHFIRHETSFVLFSTNVAETSITIPDLSLVIDLGMQCVYEKNRLLFVPCSKSSLIQRAGRTGRTCPGKVVRFMTIQDYHERPFERDPDFDWDKMYIRFMLFNCPEPFFPPQMDALHCFKKMKTLRVILPDGNLDIKKSRFITSAPLNIYHASMLYWFISSPRPKEDLFLYIFTLGFIDAYVSKNIRLYYIPENIRISRASFVSKWKELFGVFRPDELYLMLNAFSSCVLSDNPKEFSKRCCFNFKSVKLISNHLYRLFHFIEPYIQENINWKQQLDQTTSTRRSLNTFYNSHINENNKKSFFEKCRDFRGMHLVQSYFIKQHEVSIVLNFNHLLYKPSILYRIYSCLLDPTLISIQLPLLVFGVFPSQLKDNLTNTDDTRIVHFSLYTLPPQPQTNFFQTLYQSLLNKVIQHRMFRVYKKEHSYFMKNICQEIYTDVAFRPNNWAMMEKIEDFCADVRSFQTTLSF